jgi:hypothetical protein
MGPRNRSSEFNASPREVSLFPECSPDMRDLPAMARDRFFINVPPGKQPDRDDSRGEGRSEMRFVGRSLLTAGQMS